MKQTATQLCTSLMVTTLLTIFSFTSSAQCIAPAMTWANPTLVSGVELQMNAVYKFPSVTPGVDAFIKVKDIKNGATLSSIDNTTFGYSAAWQPVVKTPSTQGASESWVEFIIEFKDSIDGNKHRFDCFQLSFIDVDGDGQNVSEFVAAKNPDNFLISNISLLSISTASEMTKAMGPIANYPNLDTTAYMTNINFRYFNVDKVDEVWIGNKTNASFVVQDRYSCGYFKQISMPWQLLPVKYSSFSANVNDNKVNLAWITQYEKNNSHFEVERSFGADGYKTIGLVLDGFETGASQKSYQFRDNSKELNGQNIAYYRLKQVDIDGAISYSDVLAVRLQTTVTAVKMQVSPNPFVENVTMRFNTTSGANAEIRIISPTGVTVFSKKTIVSNGSNQLQLDGLGALPKGMYIAQLVVNGTPIESQKIIKN